MACGALLDGWFACGETSVEASEEEKTVACGTLRLSKLGFEVLADMACGTVLDSWYACGTLRVACGSPEGVACGTLW